ncbi:ANTAR domain-containing response regulator [Comamonas sp. GB3 AK4-5]|uniref:ANTAR domain-containing response regulator n=1 Tax=Comamonas sp. GB3 AK4-5 TaxID=3231487 RepID=UPI00351F2BA5
MSSSLRRLYEDLRSICVAVIHPPGEDRDVLVQQLQRIGCKLKITWPMPPEPPRDCDVILFHVSQDLEHCGDWNASTVNAALVALSDYESPTTLKLLLDSMAHGVITKPFRSSGILSTLVLARASQGFQQRLQGKIDKLENTMKMRRQIEKAVRALVEHQGMDDVQAYEHMREKAKSLRITIAEVATLLLETYEKLEQLGFSTVSRKK